MKIQTILSEGPFIQGQDRGAFKGGEFGKGVTQRPVPKTAAEIPTFKKTLYKGIKTDSGNTEDLVGTTYTNRPRTSTSGTQNAMRMYDEFVLPNLPQLKGTAKRSNCLIGTFQRFTALSFGDIAVLEVVNATSLFAWSTADFNMINDIKKAWRICELDATTRRQKEIIFDDMSTYAKQAVLKLFSNLFDTGRMGVASNLQDIPSNAEEIWFAGTVKIVQVDEDF